MGQDVSSAADQGIPHPPRLRPGDAVLIAVSLVLPFILWIGLRQAQDAPAAGALGLSGGLAGDVDAAIAARDPALWGPPKGTCGAVAEDGGMSDVSGACHDGQDLIVIFNVPSFPATTPAEVGARALQVCPEGTIGFTTSPMSIVCWGPRM